MRREFRTSPSQTQTRRRTSQETLDRTRCICRHVPVIRTFSCQPILTQNTFSLACGHRCLLFVFCQINGLFLREGQTKTAGKRRLPTRLKKQGPLALLSSFTLTLG